MCRIKKLLLKSSSHVVECIHKVIKSFCRVLECVQDQVITFSASHVPLSRRIRSFSLIVVIIVDIVSTQFIMDIFHLDLNSTQIQFLVPKNKSSTKIFGVTDALNLMCIPQLIPHCGEQMSTQSAADSLIECSSLIIGSCTSIKVSKYNTLYNWLLHETSSIKCDIIGWL